MRRRRQPAAWVAFERAAAKEPAEWVDWERHLVALGGLRGEVDNGALDSLTREYHRLEESRSLDLAVHALLP